MKTAILASTISVGFFAAASLQLAAQQPTPIADPSRPGHSAPSALPNVAHGSTASPSEFLPSPQPLPLQLSPHTEGGVPSLSTEQASVAHQYRIGLPHASNETQQLIDNRINGTPVPPLVIQFSPSNGAAVGAMEEDLTIMTRLLEKAFDQLGEAPTVSKLGLQLLFSGERRSVRASYLEGFGALFMVKVNFPVFGAPKTAQRPAENSAATKAESEWEQAKRELAGGFSENSILGEINMVASTPQFDEAVVGSLTGAIVQTLKNGGNIRGIRPEESIAVTIFGSPSGADAPIRFGVFNSAPPSAEGEAGFSGVLNVLAHDYNAATAPRCTVLTLRVKRADVDALNNGEISTEQFQSRVTNHAYVGNGHGITSLNSWVREAAPGNSAPRNSTPAPRSR